MPDYFLVVKNVVVVYGDGWSFRVSSLASYRRRSLRENGAGCGVCFVVFLLLLYPSVIAAMAAAVLALLLFTICETA